MSRVLDRFKVAPVTPLFSEPDLNVEFIERQSDVVYDVVAGTVRVRGRVYQFPPPQSGIGHGSIDDRRHEAIPALAFADKHAARLGVRCYIRGYADDVGAEVNAKQYEKNRADWMRKKQQRRLRSQDWRARQKLQSEPATVDTMSEEHDDD